jgi:glycosyltransferase involved in cell wall biosynthesis
LGASGTRNQILTRAKGEFIFPLDADDVLQPQAIKILAEGFTKADDIGWSVGRWDELYDEDQTVKEWRHVDTEAVRDKKWIAEDIKRTGQTPFAMSPVLYRTDAIMELGGWPGFPEWEDSLLLISVNRRWRGWTTPKLTGYYRRHLNQTTKDPRFKESKPVMYPYLIHVGTL